MFTIVFRHRAHIVIFFREISKEWSESTSEIPPPEKPEAKKEFVPQKPKDLPPYGKEDLIGTKKLLDTAQSDVTTKMYVHMLDRLKSLNIPEDRSIALAWEYMQRYGIEFRQMIEAWVKKEDIRAKRKIWQNEFYELHKEELSSFGASSSEDFRSPWKKWISSNHWDLPNDITPESFDSEAMSSDKWFDRIPWDISEDDGIDNLSFLQSEYTGYEEIWQERVIRDNPPPDDEVLLYTPFQDEDSEWDKFIEEKSFWTPEDIIDMPVWESMTFSFIDEAWVSEVSCSYISSGDYILRFPTGESLVIDANGDKEKAKEEILFLQDIASTPIIRRFLSSGMGKFNEFRRTLERKYSNIPAVRTTEWFIDLALSEICRIAQDNPKIPLLSEEKRVMENIESSINTQWNLTETQRFLRNNRDTLISLLSRQGILYNEWNRGINIFQVTSRM